MGTSLATAAALLIAGSAWALWQSQAGISGGRLAAGELGLERGDGTWSQVTDGVAEPASGPLGTAPESFTTMPGDVIEFKLPITTTLRGQNLNAALSVDIGRAASRDLASGAITASYLVQDAAGEQVAPAEGTAQIGEPVSPESLKGSNEGVRADWTVVVTVNVHGDYRWTQTEPLADLGSWTLDDITVDLQQARNGEGFTTGRRGT